MLVLALFALFVSPSLGLGAWTLLWMHELGHGAAALITGGEVLELHASRSSGHTLTRGGHELLIRLAGYPAPLALSGALLGAGLRLQPWGRAVALGLGAGLGSLALNDLVFDALGSAPSDLTLAGLSPAWAAPMMLMLPAVAWGVGRALRPNDQAAN